MTIATKRNTKDTVFRDFFSRKENLLALYKTLHPEDTQVTEDMLCNVTIVNVLTDQIYNDLGFTVGNRLMILVEAQSTWSENIIVRALLYLAESYRDHLDAQRQNIYSTKKITLPEPELYVIYSGDRQDKPQQLNLSKEFFDGRKTALEVSVKVLYGEDATNVIGQYVRFCKVFNMVTKQYGLTEFAAQELIRICKDENVLKAYLEEREKEVKSIMISLFDEEAIQKAYGIEKYDEGVVFGEAKGRAEGKDEQAKESAIRMYLRGMPTDVIADIVGYAENVIETWILESKTNGFYRSFVTV